MIKYYDWLVAQVCKEHQIRDFSCVLHRLMLKEYYFKNSMDANRDVEGRDMRKRYAFAFGDDADKDEGFLNLLQSNRPATVLEVLVAFTERMVFEADGWVEINTRERWFWEMLRNLGLSRMPNWELNPCALEVVDEILDIWMGGGRDGNGNGTPFPVERKDGFVGELRSNFGDLDLFYQFQGYLQDRYLR